MDWKDYYKLPLHPDSGGYNCYAWTADNNMAMDFNFELEVNDEFIAKYGDNIYGRIIDCINGKPSDIKGNWELRYGTAFFLDGEYVFEVRGWGMLRGGNKLTTEDAIKIQDGFINYIFERLTSKE